MGLDFPELSKYEDSALRYAEKNGIVEYEVEGNKMIHVERYPNEGDFRVVVDLDTWKELSREQTRKPF